MIRSDPQPLVVGLVNNMPPGAYHGMEAQFAGLLQEAGALTGVPVQLRCFATHAEMQDVCDGLDSLWQQRLDAVIVTGIQPVATGVTDEPLYPILVQVMEWAASNTKAAMWSCLAGQAAVYHLDGVARRRLPRKLSGIFRCEAAVETGLMAGAPAHWLTPHSRYNMLDPGELEQAGYRILSYGAGCGADVIEKQVGHSRFMILQGHPEYGADTLAREYRRDARQFLAGGGLAPELPVDYFDAATQLEVAELHARVLERHDPDVMTALDVVAASPPQAFWRDAALRLYVRWLEMIAGETAPRERAFVTT
jgi:homoserine O-succinyltransferase